MIRLHPQVKAMALPRHVGYSAFRRYGFSIIASLFTLLLTLLVRALVPTAPFALLFVAVMISAWYGGFGPGLLATVAAALSAVEFFLPLDHSSTILGGTMELSVLMLAGLAMGWLTTALHSAQQRAEAVQQYAQDLVHGLEAVIWEADPGTFQFTFVSQQAEAILGYPIEQWLTEPRFWDLTLHSRDQAQVIARCRQALNEGSSQAFEHRALSRDGRIVWFRTVVNSVPAVRGQAPQLRGLMVDITERKQAEEEHLHLAREQAARAEAEQVAYKLQHLQTVTDVALAHLSSPTLLYELLGRIREALDGDAAQILLLSEDGQHLVMHVAEGIAERIETTVRVPMGQGIVGRIAASRKPMIVADITAVDVTDPVFRRKSIISLVGVPLIVEGRVIGVVYVGTVARRTFTADDVNMLQLVADRIALAIDHGHLYQQLAEREERLQVLVGKLLVTQEEERRRVAYEVHDELAQIAASTHQHLQALANQHPPESSEAQEKIDRVLDLAQRTVREARRMVANLRPTVLDDFGLAVAIRHQAEELEKAGFEIGYRETLGDYRLPATMETPLFRVVQEALTNIRKHAQSAKVQIRLERRGEAIYLEVRDWGRGFEPDAVSRAGGVGERVGLAGMQERIALLQGCLTVESQPGAGTRIVAHVPVPPDAVSHTGASYAASSESSLADYA